MRTLAAMAAISCATLAPDAALACSDVYVSNPRPKQNAKDCNFRDFALDGNYAGHKAIDLGNGKIGQLIVAKQSCPYLEKLMFVDCASGEAVTVDGVLEPELQSELDEKDMQMLGGDYLIKYIQPPIGPLGVSKTSTIQAVMKSAKKHGLTYSTEVVRDFADYNSDVLARAKMAAEYNMPDAKGIVRRSLKKRAGEPFDHLCGCKLFYPDLAEASQ